MRLAASPNSTVALLQPKAVREILPFVGGHHELANRRIVAATLFNGNPDLDQIPH